MEARYLVDSSAVIKYLNNSLPEKALSFMDIAFDVEVNLSIITKVELLAWNPPNPKDLEIVERFAAQARIFPIAAGIAEVAIKIRKQCNVKLPDVFIAATAIMHDATLIADNDKDFRKIVALDIGLKYRNPFNWD